jgi:quercetin dioxygenase-like cupin family protein
MSEQPESRYRTEPRPLGKPVEVPTRPGMYVRSLVGPGDGVTELFVEEVTFHEGAAIPLHHHTVVEAWVVLDGALTMRLGDETITVGAGHTVTVPPGTPHGVLNSRAVVARALAVAPWDHATFFREATTYLEGLTRE